MQSVSGTVLVNHGNGFKPVSGTTKLGPGDTVMANPGSQAEIVFADGCRARVRPGAIVSIAAGNNAEKGTGWGEKSPCAIQITTGSIAKDGQSPNGASSAGSLGVTSGVNPYLIDRKSVV